VDLWTGVGTGILENMASMDALLGENVDATGIGDGK
jgi:hypothetical protein